MDRAINENGFFKNAILPLCAWRNLLKISRKLIILK